MQRGTSRRGFNCDTREVVIRVCHQICLSKENSIEPICISSPMEKRQSIVNASPPPIYPIPSFPTVAQH